MLDGSTSIDNVEKAICKFAGGSDFYSLDDPSLGRTLINQYLALGLIDSALRGFYLTELGRKVGNDITLIKNH